MDAYLSKPVQLADLERALAPFVARSARRRA
jgi:hypothetical protein